MTRLTIKSLSVFTILIFSCFLLYSCGEREAYYKFRELKNGNWAIDEKLEFEIDSVDFKLNTPYQISVEITNNVDYPYSNLRMFIKVFEEDSLVLDKEEELILADDFAKWKGKGFASLFQSSHLVRDSYFFKKRTNYKVHIRHGLKDENLHGIEKVGIKIKEVNN